MEDKKYNRKRTINWLENNQGNGAFDDSPEEDMNFNSLSDDELKFYFYAWLMEE